MAPAEKDQAHHQAGHDHTHTHPSGGQALSPVCADEPAHGGRHHHQQALAPGNGPGQHKGRHRQPRQHQRIQVFERIGAVVAFVGYALLFLTRSRSDHVKSPTALKKNHIFCTELRCTESRPSLWDRAMILIAHSDLNIRASGEFTSQTLLGCVFIAIAGYGMG